MPSNIKITETLTVSAFPSPLSSNSKIIRPLSHLDNDLNLRLPFRTLRFFSHVPNILSDPFHVISASLSKALFHFYPLAGTLILLSDDRLAVKCEVGDAVEMVLAECGSEICEAENLEPGSEFLNGLAPDLAFEEELVRPLALQVTRFACGGFALGMCVHHAMCDGAGAATFLSAVATFAHGENELKFKPVWDRLSLLGPRNPARVEVDLGEFLEVGGTGPYEDGDEPRLKECFHVSEVCLKQFREQLKEETGLSFTAFEALGAFIWRARVKANATPSEETVKFVYSMNISKLVNPELPSGYWGNVCVPVYAKLKASELVQQPISLTAELIKKSKHNISDQYVKSYTDFQDINYSQKITAGKFVSGFTDWRHLGHSEVDFGWGSPRVVLPLSWKILGSVEPTFLLPCDENVEKGKEGFKALVCLKEVAMEKFRKEMKMFDS